MTSQILGESMRLAALNLNCSELTIQYALLTVACCSKEAEVADAPSAERKATMLDPTSNLPNQSLRWIQASGGEAGPNLLG